MRHVICFSGGADSTVLCLWARENLPEFDTVFCDTGWEHPMTYDYIQTINEKVLGGRLITLASKWKDGMRGCVHYHGRIPSTRARFCTCELKIDPMKKYLDSIDDVVTIYQGVRGDESTKRYAQGANFYSELYDCDVRRPLFYWTKEEVFAYAKERGIEPNPLYLLGARRVGCFPCVMVSHTELKRMLVTTPEIKDRIRELEACANGRSFFPPNYIPTRFCNGLDEKTGKRYPTSDDVFWYVEGRNEDQLPMFVQPACVSAYNLCE